MTKNDRNLPYTIFLVLSSFLADSLVIFGRTYFPERLSHLACSVFPLIRLTSIFVFNQPIDYASYKCAVPLLEPSISAIFLLIKTALAASAAVCFCGQILLCRRQEIKNECANYMKNNVGIICVLKEEFLAAPAALTVVYLFVAFEFNAPPHKFRVDIFSKFFKILDV